MNNPQNMTWRKLLKEIITSPGLVSEAFRKFHRYSIGNRIMALIQLDARGIQPGPLATLKQWNKQGRKVKAGEQGVYMWQMWKRPVKCKECEGEGCQQCEGTGVAYFWKKFELKKWWFTLAQTEAIPGREQTFEEQAGAPEFNIEKVAEALEIELIPFTKMDGNVQGYAQEGRKVAINPLAEMPVRTFIHEAAHVMMDHFQDVKEIVDNLQLVKSTIEMEAESVAYIVCHALDIPGQEYSRGYVQGWWGSVEIPEKSAARIFSTANTILSKVQ